MTDAAQNITNGLHTTPQPDLRQMQTVLTTVETELASVKKFTIELRTMILVAKIALPILVSAFAGVFWQFWAMHSAVAAQAEQIGAVQQSLYDHEHDPAQQQLLAVVGDLREEVAALHESVDILKRVSLDLARDRDR